MVEHIEDILSEDELKEVRKVEDDMLDVRLAKLFLERTPHIICDAFPDHVDVEVVEDLRNPYLMAIKDKPHGKIPRRYKKSTLLGIRRNFIREFGRRRWEILKSELHLRARYIKHYINFLSRREGGYVSLVLGSACWLKKVSSGYYDFCSEQYKELGSDFGFKRGLERAVAISALNISGEQKHYVVVMDDDCMGEEAAAQKGGGVLKVLGQGKYGVDSERARKAREGFEALEETRKITILGRKRFA